jgi:hypothetical protein
MSDIPLSSSSSSRMAAAAAALLVERVIVGLNRRLLEEYPRGATVSVFNSI